MQVSALAQLGKAFQAGKLQGWFQEMFDDLCGFNLLHTWVPADVAKGWQSGANR